MLLFFIISIAFLLMLVFPVYVGIKIPFKRTEPMFIPQSNTKNPRYFAISFRNIFDKAWESYEGYELLKMSKDEEFIEADKEEIKPNELCELLVYAENKDFIPKEGIIFEKEIYARRNAILDKIPVVRAIACMGDLVIGSGTRIIRWADAEGTLVVCNNCDLGISTSSSKKLFIGMNCYFKRLYAPEIWIGRDDGGPGINNNVNIPKEVIISPWIMRNIEYVNDDVASEEGILPYTIITVHELTVLENLVVQGHISSHKDVKISSNAVVHGNIFAEGNIYIGRNAKVLGVVFTQENIYVDDDAIIGQPNKMKSVVARGNIEFGSNCRVYGYIGTEREGRICPEI